MNLTEKAIERLSASKPREIGDTTTGLYLRVSTGGRKIWRYRYRLAGKTKILTLGDWPAMPLTDARRLATAHKAQVSKGEDPASKLAQQRSERRRMPTVAGFVPQYLKHHAKPKKKSWRQDQQMLERWVIPEIGSMKLDEVGTRDIVAVIDAVKASGATRQPGKVLATLKMLFKVAILRGVIQSSPCSVVTEAQPESAEHAMSEEQIRHWWHATSEALQAAEPPCWRSSLLALRLLILTGQRPSEVADMKRSELHLESEHGSHWLIPAERRKKGRAKIGKPHAVALEPAAVEVIQQAQELHDGEYLFQREDGSAPKFPAGRPSSLYEDMANALKSLFTEEPKPTPHWCRHTVATELEDMEFDEYEIGRVLGHGGKTVTGTVYINRRVNKKALKAQRKLLKKWHKRLMKIVDGKHIDNADSIAGGSTGD